MLKMVKTINEDHLAKLGERHGVAVEASRVTGDFATGGD